jgi:hypothetical protein
MDILKISEDYVKNLFKDRLSSAYTYHNLDHTIQVVDKIKILAKEENIIPKTQKICFWQAGFTIWVILMMLIITKKKAEKKLQTF